MDTDDHPLVRAAERKLADLDIERWVTRRDLARLKWAHRPAAWVSVLLAGKEAADAAARKGLPRLHKLKKKLARLERAAIVQRKNVEDARRLVGTNRARARKAIDP
jgi:hypothetical protein